MDIDDSKLKIVLDAAIKDPKKKNMLSKIITKNFDLIQNSVADGVTYTQIAEGLGVNYSYFMTYFYRCKKKIASNSERQQTSYCSVNRQANAAQTIFINNEIETQKTKNTDGVKYMEYLQSEPTPNSLISNDDIQRPLTPVDIRKISIQDIDLSYYTNTNFKKGK